MRKTDVEKLPFKEKCKIISVIIKEYKRALIYTSMIGDEIKNKISDNNDIGSESYFRKEQLNLISVVECVLGLLKEEQKEIIENDFISVGETNWWQDKYSKTTYYAVKNQAIDNFTYFLLV